MRYSLMRHIADGKLDEFLDLQLMLLEDGVAETMGSLQAHFKTYRLPGFEITHAGIVQQMFTGQAQVRKLLAEETYPCPQCKGEQEVARSSRFRLPNVMLACGHAAFLPVSAAQPGSRAVQ